ncbi:hypothetical protein TeGR_g1723 [Tetraparma gracilis]|nr:hypothetical protein TeGR_g1723 [Tetraparma gracilis]
MISRSPTLLLLSPRTLTCKFRALSYQLRPSSVIQEKIANYLIYDAVAANPSILASSFSVIGRLGFLRYSLDAAVLSGSSRKRRQPLWLKRASREGASGDTLELLKRHDEQRQIETEMEYSLKISAIKRSKATWAAKEGYADWLRDEAGVQTEAEHGGELKATAERWVAEEEEHREAMAQRKATAMAAFVEFDERGVFAEKQQEEGGMEEEEEEEEEQETEEEEEEEEEEEVGAKAEGMSAAAKAAKAALDEFEATGEFLLKDDEEEKEDVDEEDEVLLLLLAAANTEWIDERARRAAAARAALEEFDRGNIV